MCDVWVAVCRVICVGLRVLFVFYCLMCIVCRVLYVDVHVCVLVCAACCVVNGGVRLVFAMQYVLSVVEWVLFGVGGVDMWYVSCVGYCTLCTVGCVCFHCEVY